MENQTQDQAQATMTPDVGGEIPAQSSPQLGINDLKNLVAAVDLSCRRGAFQAAEMSVIGSTFDRVNAFLNGLQTSDGTDSAASQSSPSADQSAAVPQDSAA
jgi:hypothetical protein